MNPIKKSVALPDGRVITLETGKLAKQADGSLRLTSITITRLHSVVG